MIEKPKSKPRSRSAESFREKLPVHVYYATTYEGAHEDVLTFVFVNAQQWWIDSIFEQLCKGEYGIAKGYEILDGIDRYNYHRPVRWRQGHAMWRVEVAIDELNGRMFSVDDVCVLVEAFLLHYTYAIAVDRVDIDTLLDM